MGKRSDFERKPRDFYPTPRVAVERVSDVLSVGHVGGTFCEPCAGDGALVNSVIDLLGYVCTYSFDIEPGHFSVDEGDASNRETMQRVRVACPTIITNPPWDRKMLSPMLDLWLDLDFEVWLLLSGDFMHNVWTSPYMQRCSHVVPVGRLKWEPGSKYTGKDNCAWYRFQKRPCDTLFLPRVRKSVQEKAMDDLIGGDRDLY